MTSLQILRSCCLQLPHTRGKNKMDIKLQTEINKSLLGSLFVLAVEASFVPLLNILLFNFLMGGHNFPPLKLTHTQQLISLTYFKPQESDKFSHFLFESINNIELMRWFKNRRNGGTMNRVKMRENRYLPCGRRSYITLDCGILRRFSSSCSGIDCVENVFVSRARWLAPHIHSINALWIPKWQYWHRPDKWKEKDWIKKGDELFGKWDECVKQR